MKKTLTYLFILIVSVVLSGCSIPLGDLGTLDISKDGVNVTTDESSVENGEEDVTEEEDGDQIAVDSDVGTVDEEETDTDDGKKSESPATSASSSYVCNELIQDQKGNDRALKKLKELFPPNFHLADCVFIESVNEEYYEPYKAVLVDTYFQVDGYWADVYDEYVEFLNDAGFGPLQLNENTQNMSGHIVGKTPDYHLTIELKQSDNEEAEITRMRIYIYHYDEPKED